MPTPAPRRESASPAARAVEREVRENILRQPFGAGTALDLNLPADFVRRCADRVIISSFNERYRLVVGTSPQRAEPPMPSADASKVVRLFNGASVTDGRWSGMPDQTTEVIRGFRFPRPDGTTVLKPPSESDPYELRRAAALVARSLARDGLARTALEASLTLRPLLASNASDALLASLLERAGIPIDLLAMMELPGRGGFARGGAIDWLAVRMTGGENPRRAALREVLGTARLDFRPTLETFRASDDAGAGPALLLRLQLTRGDDWLAPGDGGSLDIARQLARLLPATPLLISARRDHVPLIVRRAAEWSREASRSAPISVISEAATVSQWAQDNARAGTVTRGGARVPAALLPRYASRADELSAFVAGDSILAESLRSAGVECARSPLHLQGGNAILVDDVAAHRRVLLIGEAEIFRNVALGLSEAQAVHALQVELGADLAVVLPAASYHIDYEVFCVTDEVSGRVAAFVADTAAAECAIIESGLASLVRAGFIDQTTATRLRAAIAAERPDAAEIGNLFARLSIGIEARGGFPLELANVFAAGAAGESAVGNFLIFMDALDARAARAGMSATLGLHGHAAAALDARQRLDADRSLTRERLRSLEWDVVPIPSHSAAARSICPLNALRMGSEVLLSATGGLFADVDELAREAVSKACGQSRVTLVHVAESQRRNGGLRCAASVFR